MPRFRGTTEPAGTLIGRLLLLIAAEPHSSVMLADRLGVSTQQINRYVLQLIEAGWPIERHRVHRVGRSAISLTRPFITPYVAKALCRRRIGRSS